MNPIDPRLLADFVTFGAELIRSEDVDPLYPLLKWLERDMDAEQALWFTFLYMTYYNLPSAQLAFQWSPLPDAPDARWNKLRIATERRNLNGAKVVPHVNAYLGAIRRWGSQQAFLQQGWGEDPIANYEAFWDTAQTVWQNGRWAAFKWAEILKKVHGWNLAAPDMRMEFCSGPKAGLMLLYGLDPANMPRGEGEVWTLNYYGANLRQRCAQAGLIVPDWETLETVLCNFHSLRDGNYYIGHDIDELQERIEHSSLSAEQRHWLYVARRNALPHDYLGELNGWQGVDKAANKHYQQTGEIWSRLGVVERV